jgi:hypothetical protein
MELLLALAGFPHHANIVATGRRGGPADPRQATFFQLRGGLISGGGTPTSAASVRCLLGRGAMAKFLVLRVRTDKLGDHRHVSALAVEEVLGRRFVVSREDVAKQLRSRGGHRYYDEAQGIRAKVRSHRLSPLQG